MLHHINFSILAAIFVSLAFCVAGIVGAPIMAAVGLITAASCNAAATVGFIGFIFFVLPGAIAGAFVSEIITDFIR